MPLSIPTCSDHDGAGQVLWKVVTLWGAPKVAPFCLGIQPDTEDRKAPSKTPFLEQGLEWSQTHLSPALH